jgi:hypothetical protein
MTEQYRPTDPTMEKRWRDALESMGVPIVRARLVQSAGGSAAMISGIGTEHITKGYVEGWLREQEAKIAAEEARRYRRVLLWTMVAAVAGVVAAVARSSPRSR